MPRGFVARPGARFIKLPIRHRGGAAEGITVYDETTLLAAESIYRGTIDELRVPKLIVGSLRTDKLYGSYLNVNLGVFGTLKFGRLETTGTLPAKNIVVGSPVRLKIEGASQRIRVWDSVGSLRVELGSLT